MMDRYIQNVSQVPMGRKGTDGPDAFSKRHSVKYMANMKAALHMFPCRK
jgi:hypothetical protein